jgi:hypothetical protein
MQPDKKKDALTDLVDGIVSVIEDHLDKPLNEGEAITPSGDVVTLDAEIDDLARKIVRAIRQKKAIEKYLKAKNASK